MSFRLHLVFYVCYYLFANFFFTFCYYFYRNSVLSFFLRINKEIISLLLLLFKNNNGSKINKMSMFGKILHYNIQKESKYIHEKEYT